MNIWPLCLGQAAIALLLFFILCGISACYKRLEKTQLAVQELCDRIWEKRRDE